MSFVLKNSLLRLFFLITLIMGGALYAKPPEHITQLIDYLTEQKSHLLSASKALKNTQPPRTEAQYIDELKQNEAMLALTQANITSFEVLLANQKKIQLDFGLRIKELEKFSTDEFKLETHHLSPQEKIKRINAFNTLNKKTIQLIETNLQLAKTYQSLLKTQAQSLRLWKAHEGLLIALKQLRAEEDKLMGSLQILYKKNLELQNEIKSSVGFKSAYLLEAKLMLNDQAVNLTQQKIAALQLQRTLLRTDYLLLKNPSIRVLQKVADTYKKAINELSDMENALKKMLVVLKKESVQLTDPSLKTQFAALIKIINARLSSVSIQEQTLQEDLENHQSALKKQLSVRQSLSQLHSDSGFIILQQLAQMPKELFHYFSALILKVRDNYLWKETAATWMLWAVFISIAILFCMLKRYLKKRIGASVSVRLLSHLYGVILILLNRNLGFIAVSFSLGLLFYLNHIPFESYELIFYIMLVWLSIRIMLMLAHLGLVERMSDASGADVRLYYGIKRLMILGGSLILGMIITYELPFSLILQEVFNRLLMLYFLMVSILILKNRASIRLIINPILKPQKTYVRNALRLLLVLTPLTLLITAIIGLLGYVNLAWTLSSYEAKVLLMISLYILLRGLSGDVLEFFSEWMLSKLKNGWLWIEVFLKPLDKIMSLVVFIVCLYLLGLFFGIWMNKAFTDGLKQILIYPFINISGIYITCLSVIEFIVVLSIVVWISTWTREFCFRWLYRDTEDVGIRHSLSVFTQYAVILLGAFITLRVLGLDFSGMSMILGGLAVGMGFGLRDFASNIVGGIMLLIERPVREGDLITLGGYEGRVAHIGIRSMRVSSWDNMEVLIPNAETFNKPFTNWTHQDSIVRTVIPIKISRVDDPVFVQRLMLSILATLPDVVAEPPTQVFLKKIDEALMEFEIRYFINVQYISRSEVQSKVLFAIAQAFKEHGIKPPIPPFQLEVKVPDDTSA